jgi:hypothetical protein
VNVVLPMGDSDDLDANRAQRKVPEDCEGKVCDWECDKGQDLMATGQSTKDSSLEEMDTDSTTGGTTQYDSEPTESDAVDKLDGSIGWRERHVKHNHEDGAGNNGSSGGGGGMQ